MDNHPIPQDVTGFQFKLIGSMTIKQFGYVITGVILAVMLYYLPLHSAVGLLFKTIFIPLVGGSGFLIAFLPIEGRPFDTMFGNFIKALFSPNQFVYHKTGRLFSFSTIATPKPMTQAVQPRVHTNTTADKTKQLNQLLQSTHIQKQSPLDAKEASFLQSLASATPAVAIQPALQTQPIQPQPITPSVQPAPQPIDTTPDFLIKQEQQLNQQLEQAKKEELDNIQQARGATSEAHQKALLLERQVQALHFQRQQLEEQLTYLQKKLATQKAATTPAATVAAAQPASAPTPAVTQPIQSQPPVTTQTPPQPAVKRTGLPHTPDTPNVIAGIVRDPRGNVLPNILVEVKDKEGNPVRAFKTNALGQFASATPLTPGNYTVELEDPKKQNTFAIIQLAATNQILLPIEIISHDAREELRKQLFN